MRSLIVLCFILTAIVVVVTGLITGWTQVVAWVGFFCILVTIIVAFLFKNSSKLTKGMEDL